MLPAVVAGAVFCFVCVTASAADVAASTTGAGAPVNETPPAGSPAAGAPDGTPPNGTPPAGGSTRSASYHLSGANYVNGQTVTESDRTYTSAITDVSAVYATGGASLTLVNPTISTSGDTTSNDASSFYGLNAAVLADSNSTMTITGGSIATSGTGANGAFPSGPGASLSLSDVTITATGGGGHGVMASGDGP